MPLTPAQVKTAITIGKYGGCLPGCSGAIIMGTFNLANCDRIVVRKVRQAIEGGTIPMVPGEIANLYQPVPNQEGWWTRLDDVDPFAKPKRLVQVKIKFKGKDHEKYVMLSERSSNMAVSVANFINATEKRIKVVVSGLKSLPTRGKVTIQNFVKKWWS